MAINNLGGFQNHMGTGKYSIFSNCINAEMPSL